jgi:putative membrane protein
VNAATWHPDRTVLPFEVEPSASNHMAWMNTVFGLQRTLMAAQRTAVTMIAFGFTLAQLFQSLKSQVPPQLRALGPHIPRDVGLLMIAGGIGSLALFTWQYRRAVKYLGEGSFAAISLQPGIPLHQLSCFVAYAIKLIGLLAFASVLVSF